MNTIKTDCCIVGGGPAGMMLGLLLARAGVHTTVLEKHADFLRDFRGDTIHPSTLELIHELGLLEKFLQLPHQKASHLSAQFDRQALRIADFSNLPVQCGFIAFMPQWDFLDFLAKEAQRYVGFNLRMQAVVEELIEDDGHVRGVRAATSDGPLEVRTNLVIAADGRGSTVRACSGLALDTFGAPMDVLWFRLSRRDGDPQELMGRFSAGNILIMINRREHWQCGFVIPKGSLETLRTAGLAALQRKIVELAPFVADRSAEIRQWEDVKLLTVAVDRMPRWHQPGLLCIGDAAHAMSPVGGIGINLAIQDAVACANLLAGKLKLGNITDDDLAAVQKRREWPTRVTQQLQLLIQNRVISNVLSGTQELKPPLALRVIARIPFLQRLPARLIGLGLRPEHIRSAAIDKRY